MSEPTKIKNKIWKYMEDNDLSYKAMAKLLGVLPYQRLYQWLQNPNETFSSLIERKFNTLDD